jgi:hypothetical protein
LGYTRDGAHVSTEAFWENVPGDENGGQQGPPIDIQYMGETARIRLELTKWDTTLADALAARLSGTTPGVVKTSGTLVFAGGYYFRVLIRTTNTPINFPE